MNKNCENCNKGFTPSQPHQRFCCTSCRQENHYKRKFGLLGTFTDVKNGQPTERTTDEQNGLKTAKNADMGIFERLMDEREARISDKIALAKAEMEITMLKKELESAQGLAGIAKELAPVIAQLFTPTTTPKQPE